MEEEGKGRRKKKGPVGSMVRKRDALVIRMRVRGEGAVAAARKFGVSNKRDTPIVSLLEQGRDPPLLQTREDGDQQREMSKGEVGWEQKTTDALTPCTGRGFSAYTCRVRLTSPDTMYACKSNVRASSALVNEYALHLTEALQDGAGVSLEGVRWQTCER